MTWFMSREFLEKLDLRSYDAAAIAKRLDMDVDVVRRFVDPLRRYTVQTSNYGWVAGVGNDRPALVFIGQPRLSGSDQDPLNAVLFEPDGTVRTQAIRCDDSILEDEEALLDLLYDELGFTHVGTAVVSAFKHPQLWHYALVPFPWSLHEIALGESEDRGADGLATVRNWIEDGGFVLHCGNDYWLDAEGEVESS